VGDWLAAARLGLVAMALVVGAGAGLAAAGFRDLISLLTWVFTAPSAAHEAEQAPSTHPTREEQCPG
jgi:CIC family chloride channel protein